MYTGTTEKPCCLCDTEDVRTRLELPPRAVQLMENGDPIAWQDIESTVTVFFCERDWATIRDLVLEVGMSPLPRCNVARASFDLREDFEALLNDVRDQPDQSAMEHRLLTKARETIETHENGGQVEDRDVVEALVVVWALEELGVADR